MALPKSGPLLANGSFQQVSFCIEAWLLSFSALDARTLDTGTEKTEIIQWLETGSQTLMTYRVEPGLFKVWIGSNSTGGLEGEVEVR